MRGSASQGRDAPSLVGMLLRAGGPGRSRHKDECADVRGPSVTHRLPPERPDGRLGKQKGPPRATYIPNPANSSPGAFRGLHCWRPHKPQHTPLASFLEFGKDSWEISRKQDSPHPVGFSLV